LGPSINLRLLNFSKGAYITVEGKKAEFFYIIKSGTVEIQRDVVIDDETPSVTLNPGDLFGVVSAMSEHSHIDIAMALSDCVVIGVKSGDYPSLIEKSSSIALKIINGFSERVRLLDEALTKRAFKNAAEIDTSHLFEVAEYYAKQNKYNQAYYAYSKYILAQPQGNNFATSKERMAKIEPYQKAVHINPAKDEFMRSYPKDTMVICEGEDGAEAFIIQKGSIKITKIVNDNEVQLALLQAGDIFGEMALLNNQPRSASAIANENTDMMVVTKSNFVKMVSEQPKLTTRLTTLLSDRIWTLYRQLGNAMIEDPVGRLCDALVLELEKQKINPDTKINYTFGLTPEDLIKSVGLPNAEGRQAIEKLFKEIKMSLVDGKIFCENIQEIKKSANYYSKMQKRKKAQSERK
jgi:CRP-like cAMP-binding protein